MPISESSICGHCGKFGLHCPNCGGRSVYRHNGRSLEASAEQGRKIDIYRCRSKCGMYFSSEDTCKVPLRASLSSLSIAGMSEEDKAEAIANPLKLAKKLAREGKMPLEIKEVFVALGIPIIIEGDQPAAKPLEDTPCSETKAINETTAAPLTLDEIISKSKQGSFTVQTDDDRKETLDGSEDKEKNKD